jgi:hypothetical protein
VTAGGPAQRWAGDVTRASPLRRWCVPAGPWGRGARVACLAACYYATAQVGFSLQFIGPIAAIVWLPVGVGIPSLSSRT